MIPNTANASLEGDDLDLELAMATTPVDASGAIPGQNPETRDLPANANGNVTRAIDLVGDLANIADNTELIRAAVQRVEASLEAVLKILNPPQT